MYYDSIFFFFLDTGNFLHDVYYWNTVYSQLKVWVSILGNTTKIFKISTTLEMQRILILHIIITQEDKELINW